MTFIDPGSAVCTVTKEAVRKYHIQCLPSSQNLRGFGMPQVISSQWGARLTLKIDEVERETEFVVVPTAAQSMGFLISRILTDAPDVAYLSLLSERARTTN